VTFQVVEYFEVDSLENANHVPVVSVQMNNVEDVMMDNMAKLDNVNLAEKAPDPFLAVVDDAPLARPEVNPQTHKICTCFLF
jgi:hypothetical protein